MMYEDIFDDAHWHEVDLARREAESRIASYADLDSVYTLASGERSEDGSTNKKHLGHGWITGTADMDAIEGDVYRQERIAHKPLAWYVGYRLPRNFSHGIFLVWYVAVLAALTVALGYFVGSLA